MYILICWSVAGRPGTSVLFLGEIPMLPAHTLRPEERVKPAPPVWPTYGWATPALRPTKPAIPRVAGRPTLLSRGRRAGTDDEGHPQGQDVIDFDAGVGQQPVDLFDGMLGQQATRGGQAVADGRDGERAAVQHAEGGVAQAVDALGVQIRTEQAAEDLTNLVERELTGGGHDKLRGI